MLAHILEGDNRQISNFSLMITEWSLLSIINLLES